MCSNVDKSNIQSTKLKKTLKNDKLPLSTVSISIYDAIKVLL